MAIGWRAATMIVQRWAQWALEVGAVGARSSGEACAALECGDHGSGDRCAGGRSGRKWYMWCTMVGARWAQWALSSGEAWLHGSAAVTELWR